MCQEFAQDEECEEGVFIAELFDQLCVITWFLCVLIYLGLLLTEFILLFSSASQRKLHT